MNPLTTMAELAAAGYTVTSWQHKDGHWCCRAEIASGGMLNSITINDPDRATSIQGAREVIERIRTHHNCEESGWALLERMKGV